MTSRVIIGVNSLSRRLFDLKRRQTIRKLKYQKKIDALSLAFNAEDAYDRVEFESVKKLLRNLVDTHTDELFSGKLKSFATVFAIVSSRTVHLGLKVLDQRRAVKAARALRIFNEVCVVTVTVNPAKLEKHLKEHPEHRSRFGDSIQPASSYESRSAKPNGRYFATHDPDQLTDEAIQLTEQP